MSGFFGVTSLGPQFPIASNMLSTLGITSFTDEDFKQSFEALADASGSINKIDVYDCLTRTYGFEPMPEEINLFVTSLTLADDGLLSWTEFQQGLAEIRDKVTTIAKKATHYDFPPPQVTTIAKKATHYDSLQDMVDDTRKHSRVKYGPMDIYKRPMTTAQAVGWHEEEVFNERFPKTQCAEVKYADCLVKSGWVS